GFLASAGTGLAGIALASLLRGEKLLGASSLVEPAPKWPLIRPEAPLAARPPLLAPKAKRVLVIFCSGACSQLETWDYKPELMKRDGQPMPGADKLITFQGE